MFGLKPRYVLAYSNLDDNKPVRDCKACWRDFKAIIPAKRFSCNKNYNRRY